MKRNHLTVTSLIAAFGLLAMVFTLWMRQPAQDNQIKAKSAPAHHVLCASSTSFYIAEVKSKFSGLALGNALFGFIANNLLSHKKPTEWVLVHHNASANPSPPLWLLNRALLI